jgi:hypothetical protein
MWSCEEERKDSDLISAVSEVFSLLDEIALPAARYDIKSQFFVKNGIGTQALRPRVN